MATSNRDTLNQVISELQTIADNHYQINTFGFGDIWEINTSGDIQYPLMWAVLDGVDISDNTESVKFNLIFCDVVKGGEVNEQDVLNDQLEIAKDVIAQLQHHNYPWNFEGNNVKLEDFTERFTDSVAGWNASLTLELIYKSNRCAIPTSDSSVTEGGSASSGGSAAGTINVYLDGVLQSSTASSDLDAEVVNIIWT